MMLNPKGIFKGIFIESMHLWELIISIQNNKLILYSHFFHLLTTITNLSEKNNRPLCGKYMKNSGIAMLQKTVCRQHNPTSHLYLQASKVYFSICMINWWADRMTAQRLRWLKMNSSMLKLWKRLSKKSWEDIILTSTRITSAMRALLTISMRYVESLTKYLKQ